MSTLRVTEPMVSSDEAYAQVEARLGVEEIDDAVARTIAGWWASPGTVGPVLAALSTGCEVSVYDLLDDIARTRRQHLDMAPKDKAALDMLGTWAIYRSR